MFLEILCSACTLYDVQLHAYVLMYNHYHLLIERWLKPYHAYTTPLYFKTSKRKMKENHFLQSTADERILTEIKKASSLVVTSASQKVLDKQHLESMLSKIIDTEDRNTKILQAYNEG